MTFPTATLRRLTTLRTDRVFVIRVATFAIVILAAAFLLSFLRATLYRGLVAPPPADAEQASTKQETLNRTLLTTVQQKDEAKRAHASDVPASPF